MAKTDTDERYAGAASGKEGRFFAELHKLVPLSENVKQIDFRFGEDSDNEPAVWISIHTSADDNPAKAKIAELNRAAEALRSAILKSEYKRWPYVQIKAE